MVRGRFYKREWVRKRIKKREKEKQREGEYERKMRQTRQRQIVRYTYKSDKHGDR